MPNYDALPEALPVIREVYDQAENPERAPKSLLSRALWILAPRITAVAKVSDMVSKRSFAWRTGGGSEERLSQLFSTKCETVFRCKALRLRASGTRFRVFGFHGFQPGALAQRRDRLCRREKKKSKMSSRLIETRLQH